MKSKQFLFSIVLGLALNSAILAQNAYLDASDIMKSYDKAAGKIVLNDAVLKKLQNYATEKISDPQICIKYFEKNSFIHGLLLPLESVDADAENKSPQGENKTDSSSSFTGFANLNVTNMVDGVARFIIKRSKEELNIAYFRKLKEFLQKYPDMDTLFPNTTGFLSEIYSYEYATMMPALRNAFQNDIKDIILHIANLRNVSPAQCPKEDKACDQRVIKISKYFQSAEGGIVGSALLVTGEIMSGVHPSVAIHDLAFDKALRQFDTNFMNIIKFVDLISYNLRSGNKMKYWIEEADFTKLHGDEVLRKVFFGLLFEINKSKYNINFKFGSNVLTLDSLLKIYITKNTVTGKSWFEKNYAIYKSISKIIDSLRNCSDKTEVKKKYALYWEIIKSSEELLSLNADSLVKHGVNIPASFNDFMTWSNHVIDLVENFKNKNYQAAVLDASEILKKVVADANFNKKFLHYGIFIASIAQAEKAEDIEAVLDATVLPAGSSATKRLTERNISINAYFGPFYSYEMIPKLSQKFNSPTVGLTAPIGIAFSCGKRKCFVDNLDKESGWSSTLFLSLVDLGVPTAFRMKSDAEKMPTIQLKHILAPGVFYYIGISKSPISIGIGAQCGPLLREITDGKAVEADNFYWRASFSVVVDMPLFDLYTREE